MAWNPFDVNVNIPESIENAFTIFKNLALDVHIMLLSVFVILIVTLFFGLVALIFWLPVKIYPYYKQHEKMFKRLINLTKT